jgi:hypothetical protein
MRPSGRAPKKPNSGGSAAEVSRRPVFPLWAGGGNRARQGTEWRLDQGSWPDQFFEFLYAVSDPGGDRIGQRVLHQAANPAGHQFEPPPAVIWGRRCTGEPWASLCDHVRRRYSLPGGHVDGCPQ